jgi:phenylacetic acid degradation operon negative regulatory protein
LIAMCAPLAIAADQYDTASSPSQPSVCHFTRMTSQLDGATRALVTTFRRQRPVGGGSLIITIFGDAIAPRGGVVSLGSLIKLCEPFGITERLVRTSVARLAEADWLGTQRYGRRAEYHLSARGLRRFADATRRIYSAGPDHWNGMWTLVLLPTSDSEAREALRKELAWLGFGQPMAGVMIHPTRPATDTREQLSGVRGESRVTVFEARNDNPAADERFASESWDLRELAGRYRKFVTTFDPVAAATAAGRRPAPRTAFIIRTLLVHQYRKIHLRDPVLPTLLLPTDWVGKRAYELCRDLYSYVFESAEVYLSNEASRLSSELPPVSAAALQRFGGVLATSAVE